MVREYPHYNFPYAGVINDSSLHNVGYSGAYWSRTVGSNHSQYVYSLILGSSNVDPVSYYNGRYVGFSIRCVATT